MGQKTKGYRRGETYGLSTNRKGRGKGSHGWQYRTNGVGQYGHHHSVVCNSSSDYGIHSQDCISLSYSIEQLLYSKGCTSNGIGVTGSRKHGYTLHGEYRMSNTNPKDVNASRARFEAIAEGSRGTKVSRKRMSVEELRNNEDSEQLETLYLGISKSFRVRGPESRVSSKDMWRGIARAGKVPNSTLLGKRVARQLEDTIQHLKVIREVERIRATHAYETTHGIKTSRQPLKDGYWGYKVIVKGVIGGSLRTSKYVIQGGQIPESTKKARIASSHSVAKTPIGTRGVQVDYCYGIG